MHLQNVFQLVHPFAGTKFVPMERAKVIKAASEVQLAVQNLVQGVKSRNNALAQFVGRAEEKLVYFTQIFIASIWNLHVAVEFISNEMLEAEIREFGSVFKEIIACALNQSSQSYSEVSCFAKKASVQTIMTVNSKLIEIYHSGCQEKLAETGFTMFKGTKGILMAAERVKKDPQSPHRATMTKLAKVVLFNINKVCEILQDPELYQMHNFLDENTERQVIMDSTQQLLQNIQKYSSSERELHPEEQEMLEEMRSLNTEIQLLYRSTQPESYSQYEIIAAARRIGVSIDKIAKSALSFLGDAASELLESYLVTSLKACIYFSNQVKIVASSMSVSYPITTKMMLPLSIRSLTTSLMGAMEAVETCVTIFDNPLDFEMDGILDSLDFTDPLKEEPEISPLSGMQTIRSTKQSVASDIKPVSQLVRPAPAKKKNEMANMATLRVPRNSSPAAPTNTGPSEQQAPSENPSALNELDALLGIAPAPQSINTQTPKQAPPPAGQQSAEALNELDSLLGIAPAPSSITRSPAQNVTPMDPLDELDALVNISSSKPVSNPSNTQQMPSNDALDELDALVNVSSTNTSYSSFQEHVGSSSMNSNSFMSAGNPVESLDPLDELDALVNIDSAPRGQMNPPTASTVTQELDPLDELDALVNLGGSVPPAPANQTSLDPLDELESLANISSTGPSQNFSLEQLVNIDTMPAASATQQEEYDPLAELDELVNL